MGFRISGLPLASFAPLFKLSDAELASRTMLRQVADNKPGFPCRVSLEDADPGERVILLNYEHQSAASPFRSSHAIYVRENAREAKLRTNETPELLRSRLLSVRAFDANGLMIDADVVDGRELERGIDGLFANTAAEYLHVHYAKYGCYAARVDRA